ncbi:MAG: proline dehydrogenase family protein [Gemmatimonadetes bacterium]|nr:proline dehydrogenase family protein [Gemmatimonadota bacterium]MDA1103847.1 proline dehydrogenase family protein [Gemmatimonadota bacterium]
MLRNTLLWASTNPLLAEKLPRYRFVKKATKRFMPGEELGDALVEAGALGQLGIATTTTLLGENLRSLDEADGVVSHYRGALKEIEARGLDTEISVKPTQLGLDFGLEEARSRLTQLASSTSTLVWVDMEGSGYVDRTLDLFRGVKRDHPNVGLCLQSYLFRTADDLESLLPLDPAIRLVKGAYNESEGVAFPKKADVDRNFVKLTQTLLRARLNGGEGRPVLGTHDPKVIGETNRIAYELGLAKDRYEFAMLFGIQRAEQERLARTGHTVRVLVSYGAAWFPWYMRRLAERPANLWFVAKQLVG